MSKPRRDDPEKRRLKGVRRRARRAAVEAGAQMMPRKARPTAQMDHGSNPNGLRKARAGERAMERERQEKVGSMVVNIAAVESRHRAATEVGLRVGNRSLDRGEGTTLFASCSDIPGLIDHIRQLRGIVADEITTYANQCQTMAQRVEDEMTTCANDHNRSTIQVYLQAANIARAGLSYKNTNCTRCHDTRGGVEGHRTEDCAWAPPVDFFEDREQCYGRDLVQVGWMGPYGIIPGGMDNDPVPHWRPIFMHKVV